MPSSEVKRQCAQESFFRVWICAGSVEAEDGRMKSISQVVSTRFDFRNLAESKAGIGDSPKDKLWMSHEICDTFQQRSRFKHECRESDLVKVHADPDCICQATERTRWGVSLFKCRRRTSNLLQNLGDFSQLTLTDHAHQQIPFLFIQHLGIIRTCSITSSSFAISGTSKARRGVTGAIFGMRRGIGTSPNAVDETHDESK